MGAMGTYEGGYEERFDFGVWWDESILSFYVGVETETTIEGPT